MDGTFQYLHEGHRQVLAEISCIPENYRAVSVKNSKVN